MKRLCTKRFSSAQSRNLQALRPTHTHNIGFRHKIMLDRTACVYLHDAIDDGYGEAIQRARAGALTSSPSRS